MLAEQLQIPAGPAGPYDAHDDLLEWMGRQFAVFGDVYKASVYGAGVYVVRNLDFAHHMLVGNWRTYTKGQFIKRVAFLLGNGSMVSEGELWKRQRRMIQPAFEHNSIGALTTLISTANLKLLTKWRLAAKRHESVNVTRDVSGMALEVVLRFILGDDYDRTGFHFDVLSEQPARDFAFAREFRALGKIILQVAARRRKDLSTSTDALGVLMGARDPRSGQSMQDRQLVNEILTLIVAGHETTASALNWTWYLISQHPDVERRLSEEAITLTSLPALEDLNNFPYARQVLDESLRLYPAGWLMTRKALRDDRLGGYFVPAGTEVYISPYFVHRNPGVWEDPDRFNPDRFGPDNSQYRHRLAAMPFSAGPRNCIGAYFARIEMQIHLMMIAIHLRLRYVQSRPPELDAGVNLRSKDDFIMYPELLSGEPC